MSHDSMPGSAYGGASPNTTTLGTSTTPLGHTTTLGSPTTPLGNTTTLGARAPSRPGVVQLAIKERPALYASYMPFLDGGGLFVPTTRPANLGDEVYLILQLLDDPNKTPVTGKVVWITPADTPGRQQGIGVQFSKDQGGEQARTRIENLLGGALATTHRQTHTI